MQKLAIFKIFAPESVAHWIHFLGKGFLEVVSGPLVPSSYRADRVFEKNNCGIDSDVA